MALQGLYLDDRCNSHSWQAYQLSNLHGMHTLPLVESLVEISPNARQNTDSNV